MHGPDRFVVSGVVEAEQQPERVLAQHVARFVVVAPRDASLRDQLLFSYVGHPRAGVRRVASVASRFEARHDTNP